VIDQQFDTHMGRLKFSGARPPALLLFGLAFLLMAPFVFYLVILTIWHWKGRYRGTHSDVWGAVLIIETSGFLKLVYLFRHLIPDARRTGRYRRVANEREQPG
jgi:hypothetical protein